VWHPQLETNENATRRTVDVSHERRIEAAWTVPLKQEVRVRRAPTAERGGTRY